MFADKRYAVALECCGYSEPRFVLRFCGGWVGQFFTAHGAWVYARIIKDARLARKSGV